MSVCSLIRRFSLDCRLRTMRQRSRALSHLPIALSCRNGHVGGATIWQVRILHHGSGPSNRCSRSLQGLAVLSPRPGVPALLVPQTLHSHGEIHQTTLLQATESIELIDSCLRTDNLLSCALQKLVLLHFRVCCCLPQPHAEIGPVLASAEVDSHRPFDTHFFFYATGSSSNGRGLCFPGRISCNAA